jgi:uncharacterized protein YgbK (DUF1537 family)
MRSTCTTARSAGPPPTPSSRGLVVLADDLSGAAEVAALVADRLQGTRIVLTVGQRGPDGDARSPAICAQRAGGSSQQAPAVMVFDLDTRRGAAGDAARRVGEALGSLRGGPASGPLLLKKIDSLLRGHLGAELAAIHAAGRPLVIAPALPVARRTVQGGVLLLDGVPLHDTDAWRAEAATPPRTVTAALAPLRTAGVDLATVRAGTDAVRQRLTALAADGLGAVCDAETDADLETIVAAAAGVPGACLVGSGGLAAALGRRRAGGLGDAVGPPDPGRTAAPLGPLVVVGTGEPGAREQVDLLAARGVPVHALAVADLLAVAPSTEALDAVAADLHAGAAVLRLHAPEGIAAGASRELVAALAAVVARLAAEPAVDLVLTGGETARCVLDALGIEALEPVAQIHHGAVHSVTPDGRAVVTRPGSFGGPDSLVRIVDALRPTRPMPSTTPPRGTSV